MKVSGPAQSPEGSTLKPFGTISRHLEKIIEPLSPATCKLLVEVTGLLPNDFVEICLEDEVLEETEQVLTKRFIVRFKSKDTDGRDVAPSHRLRGHWWVNIPGAKVLTDYSSYGFTCPPSDISALVIIAAVGMERIKYEDELAELEFKTVVMRFIQASKVTKAPAGFKVHRSVPNDAPTGKPGLAPMPAQQVAAWAATRSEAYALWMEQSTGKTYAAIMSVEESYIAPTDEKPNPCQFVMVACPKNVRKQWELELERFSKRRIRVFRLDGTDIDRLGILLEAFKQKLSGHYDFTYVITSYQVAVNSQTQIAAYPWDWIVLDEAHNIKSPRAKRSKTMLKLRDKAKRRLALTGTPITNHIFDLWTQLEFLGRGWSGFSSFDAFRKFYGVWAPSSHHNGLEFLLAVQNLPLLQERMARSAFLLTKKQALPDLPDKTYTLIECELSAQQKVVYQQLAIQICLEIEADIASAEASGRTITMTNVLTRLLRLSQVTSGFLVLDGDIDPETGMIDPKSRMIDRFDPNDKLEQLVEFLKEKPELSKAIVWCCYTQDIKTISARLKVEGIRCCTYYGDTSEQERANIELAWNTDPDLGVLVGNPAAGGVGLNLQGYCKANDDNGGYTRADMVIFFSQNWSPTTRSQAEERPRGYVHESKTESGKREVWPIQVFDFCVLDSIDMQIRNRVSQKRTSAMQVQDIREILAQVIAKTE